MNEWQTSSRLGESKNRLASYVVQTGIRQKHIICQCRVVKKIKKHVGLGGGELDFRWAYFADVDWGWPRTLAAQRLLVGSVSLRVALADALASQYVTEEKIWNAKMYVAACTNAVMDLRTPMRTRGHGLGPETVDDLWFQ